MLLLGILLFLFSIIIGIIITAFVVDEIWEQVLVMILLVVSFLAGAFIANQITYEKAALGHNPLKAEILYKALNDSVMIPYDTIIVEIK